MRLSSKLSTFSKPADGGGDKIFWVWILRECGALPDGTDLAWGRICHKTVNAEKYCEILNESERAASSPV